MNILNMVVLPLLLSIKTQVVQTLSLPSFDWKSSNPFFAENKTLCVKEFDTLTFFCPSYERTLLSANEVLFTASTLNENMWIVDKKSYENCKVNTSISTNRLYTKCNYNQNKCDFLKESFSKLRASPADQKYDSWNTYYFISTSDGTEESLNNTEGGHCKTHNMRLKFFVYDAEKCEDCSTRNKAKKKPLDFFTCNPKCTKSNKTNTIIKCKMNWEEEKKDCDCGSISQIKTTKQVNNSGSTVKTMSLQLITTTDVNNLDSTVKSTTLEVTTPENSNNLGHVVIELSSLQLLLIISLLTNYISQ